MNEFRIRSLTYIEVPFFLGTYLASERTLPKLLTLYIPSYPSISFHISWFFILDAFKLSR